MEGVKNKAYHCFSDRDNYSTPNRDEGTSVNVYEMLSYAENAEKPSNTESNVSGKVKSVYPEDCNKTGKFEQISTNNLGNGLKNKARTSLLIAFVLLIGCVLLSIAAGIVVENIISKKLDDDTQEERIRTEHLKTYAEWSSWNQWGRCSVSCDLGLVSRQRTCSMQNVTVKDEYCTGLPHQVQICMERSCADGGWGDWGPWDTCSKTCGIGHKTRTRLCNNPKPSVIGASCKGLQADTDLCLKQACAGECEDYLVSGINGVPDSHITASSSYEESSAGAHTPYRARLYNVEERTGLGGWSAAVSDQQQWIQVKFLDTKLVTGVATQGRDDSLGSKQWVKEYKVLYSENCIDFHYIQTGNGSIQVFTGNSDASTIVKNTVGTPFWAKCIRIKPVTWHVHISIRFDVLGCTYDAYRLIKLLV